MKDRERDRQTDRKIRVLEEPRWSLCSAVGKYKAVAGSVENLCLNETSG